jgi:hypothetical protein
MLQHFVRPVARPHHLGWISRAIAAGFLASVATLLPVAAAYGVAAAVGSTGPTATILSRWCWHLSHNPVTSLVVSVHLLQAIELHLLMGVGWAISYAGVVEPKLEGPGWRKGLVFALVPCLVSLSLVLPFVGVGFFGLAIGAGFLPGGSAILLHAVYGVLLGGAYAVADGENLEGTADHVLAKTVTLVERDLALGLVVGALFGAVIAGVLAGAVGSAVSATSTSLLLTGGGGATEGALCGAVIGVLMGLLTVE